MTPSAPFSTPDTKRWLHLCCALVPLLAVLLLHREVLFGGMVYHMDDAADGYYPSHVAIARAFQHGELPTWERGSWSGFPLLSDPYYGAFYPLSLTFYLFGMVRGLGWNIALHMLLGAAGMFTLLRRRGHHAGPALMGAVALGLSSFMVERIRHIIFAQLLSWLPWVLCCAEGYLQTRRRRELPLLSLTLGLGLICGGLPLLPYVALVLGAYVLLRALRAPRPAAALFALGVAVIVGCLLAMAQIVPTLAHLPYSPRLLGAEYSFASSYAWPNRDYLFTLLAPDWLGGTQRGTWHGVYNHWEMAGWYVGALPVLLAPLGLLRSRGRPELIGLVAVALLGIGLAFGDAGPVHPWFYRHVPVYAALRCPVRALFMFLIAAPILGAEGLTWLLDRVSRPLWRPRLLGALLFCIAAGALACGMAFRPRISPYLGQALLHLLIVLLPACVGILLVAAGLLRGPTAGLLLGFWTTLDLLVIDRGYLQPRPADFAQGTERFAAVDWLLAQKPEDRFAIDPTGPFRLHNLGMVYGIEGACGYDSFSIWRYVHFLYILNTGAPYPYPHLRHDPAAGDIQRFDSPLCDLLNVRWVIGPRQPAAGWTERYRLPPFEPLHAQHEPQWDRLLRVYENPHPLPRAFVVYEAEVLPDEQDQARALPRLDPRTRVLLDRVPVPAPQSDGSRSFVPARITQLQRHQISIEAETRTPGVLVISEPSYPGWTATLDGAEVPLLVADYAFRGVALPAGRHTVVMRFRSKPTERGLLLSAIGLLGLIGLSVHVRRRRSGTVFR